VAAADGAGPSEDRLAVIGVSFLHTPEAPAGESAPAVVAARRAGLVQATPAGPVQHRLRRGPDAHEQAVDQPTDLGDSEWDQGAVGGQLRHQSPPLSALPGRWERATARLANASMASVMWRYQPW
jgi:hypothetical protein